MAIQNSDAFLVARSGTNYQTPASNLMTIQDTDLLAVNRGGTNYKVTGLDVKNYINPSGAGAAFLDPTSQGTITGQYTPPGDIQFDGSRYYANGLVTDDWSQPIMGYQISDDGGITWTWAPRATDFFIRQAVVAPDGNLLGFGGTLGDPTAGWRPGNDSSSGLYRSTDQGGSWTLVDSYAPSNLSRSCINVDSVSGNIIAIGSLSSWRESSDSGLTWQSVVPAGTTRTFNASVSPTNAVVGARGYWWTVSTGASSSAVRFPQATASPTITSLGSLGASYVGGCAATSGLATDFVAMTGAQICSVFDAATGAQIGGVAGTSSNYGVTCSWVPSAGKLVVSQYDPPSGSGIGISGPLYVSSDGVNFTDVQTSQPAPLVRPLIFSEVGGQVVAPSAGANLLLSGWVL